MDPLVSSSLIQAGSGAANALINQAFAEHNRKRNYYWNEKAADAADQRQRAQYKDLYSPQAMLDQYAAAGLSPSMMMGGGQSAVGGTPAGAQGSINGPYPSGNLIDPVAAAQIANINADTKVKEQQAVNIGADTEFTMANIIKAAEETENYRQQNMLLKLQRDKLQLDIYVKSATTDEEIKQCIERTKQMYETTEKLRQENQSLILQNQLDSATLQTRIKQAGQEYETEIAETALTWANVKLSGQQVQSLIDNVAINQQNANINQQNADTNRQNAETNRQNAETNEYNAETQRTYINGIIEQWAIQNGFTEQELKQGRTKMWLDFVANIIGSILNLANGILNFVGKK